MIRKVVLLLVLILPPAVSGCADQPTSPSMVSASASSLGGAATSATGGRARSGGVVFVTSQELYYDTFVAQDPLPMEGPFQLLENGRTMYGPGQPGYLGGRWWEDLNRNGVQDAGDHFFLCPLLPPGRPTP